MLDPTPSLVSLGLLSVGTYSFSSLRGLINLMPHQYFSSIDMLMLWYAPGPVLRRLAFGAELPATPPQNVRHKNQKIKKLGSWQTPSKRSVESYRTKKGRIRGRKFYRVTRKKLRPLHQPLHQPLNQPHSPHQPLWLHRSLLLRDTSLWQRRSPPPTHRPILLRYPRQLFWGRSCSSQGRQHPLHHLFLFRTQTRLRRGISVVLKMMNNGPLL